MTTEQERTPTTAGGALAGQGLGAPSLALSKVSVLEVGGSLPGRLLAKLLADQGAAVEHLVTAGGAPPAYDFDRAAPPRVLDLAAAEGRAALRRMSEGVDVVIDGLGAGGLRALGAGYEELAAANAGLLYCALSAMPEEAGERGDLLEWKIAGELGLHRAGSGAPEAEPIRLVSAYGALQAAVYLAAGLIFRDRHGAGSRIDVSLFGAGIMALNRRLLSVEDPSVSDPLGTYRVPIAERYRCADGRYLQSQGAVDTVAASVMRALGHPEWIEPVVGGLTALGTKDEEVTWRARFAETFAGRPALEWEAAVAAEGGAGAVCRTREEWRSETHAAEADIFRDDGNGEKVLGPAVRVFSPGPGAGPVPWPASDASNRLPLEGLRVVDLAIILAGPTCGRLLGELGADVIKVDAPDRTDLPWVSPYGWLDVNRTKRSVLLDLKTDAGKEVLWRLVAEADVLVENYRAGKIASLGFSFENLARVNPDIVYVSMNAYDFGGEFAGRPGWEQNAQAMTGMQTARAKDGLPRQVLVPLNDFGTGYLGAYGTLCAILAARRSGAPQRVLGSLSRTGTFLQCLEYSQVGALEAGPTVAFFEAADGFVAVDASTTAGEQVGALVAGRDVAGALRALAEAGVDAAPARRPEDLPDLDWVRRSGLVSSWEHPSWGAMTNVFAHARATAFGQRRGWPAENPGAATRAVLGEVGYRPEEIEMFLEKGVAVEEIPLFGQR